MFAKTRVLLVLVLFLSAGCAAAVEAPVAEVAADTAQVWDGEPVNDLPTRYERVEPWAQLPEGTNSWAAVIGAEPGPDGNLYVLTRCFENSCADRPEPAIIKYNMDGEPLMTWGVGMFDYTHGFHVDRDGNVWASDIGRAESPYGHQVVKFSPEGEVLMTIGEMGVRGAPADGLLDQPTDVLVLPSGDFLVTEGHTRDGGSDRVSKFSADGTFIESWGQSGSGPGEFLAPHTIAMDSQQRIFIGDRSNNRIQIFDQDMNFLEEWKQFSRPSGIYITDDDTIYVADSESWGPDNPEWKKGIRIGNARDGSVQWFIEDIESMTQDHSGAEGVGVDGEGNVYGGVVRRRMLEKHVLRQ